MTFETQGNCEYLRQTLSTPTTTTDTNYNNWLHLPNRPQSLQQSNVYTRTAIRQ